MVRTVVGVIRGGTSSEADLSLKTGAAILNALPEERFDVRDVFVDKVGMWNTRGIPVAPGRVLSQVDVLVNALHGGEGESGAIARMAQRAGIPFTGSGPLGGGQSQNKFLARSLLRRAGVPMPRAVPIFLKPHTSIDVTVVVRYVFDRFSPPYIIKPMNEGASHGIRLAAGYFDLGEVLSDMLQTYESVLVEEYVAGLEGTVGVIEGFRNEDIYALPPAELGLPTGHKFMPSDVYRTGLELRTPAPMISYADKNEMMRLAKIAHQELGLENYSRADFIVTPRGPLLLEINALPGLYEGAAMPKMLEVVGARVPDLMEHTINRELSLGV